MPKYSNGIKNNRLILILMSRRERRERRQLRKHIRE